MKYRFTKYLTSKKFTSFLSAQAAAQESAVYEFVSVMFTSMPGWANILSEHTLSCVFVFVCLFEYIHNIYLSENHFENLIALALHSCDQSYCASFSPSIENESTFQKEIVFRSKGCPKKMLTKFRGYYWNTRFWGEDGLHWFNVARNGPYCPNCPQ